MGLLEQSAIHDDDPLGVAKRSFAELPPEALFLAHACVLLGVRRMQHEGSSEYAIREAQARHPFREIWHEHTTLSYEAAEIANLQASMASDEPDIQSLDWRVEFESLCDICVPGQPFDRKKQRAESQASAYPKLHQVITRLWTLEYTN